MAEVASLAVDDAAVEVLAQQGHAGDGKVVFLMALRQTEHHGQHLGDFLSSAAGEEDDGLAPGVDGGVVVDVECVYGIQQGVPHVDGLGQTVVFIVVLLEGEYVAEPVEVAAHLLDAACLPGPQLRRDVVHGLDAVLVGVARHLEVESRVVDSHQHVGPPVEDVLLAEAYVVHHCRQVGQHLDEAHEGHVADVAHGLPAHGPHLVASPVAEFRFGVLVAEGAHEVGTVEVAGRFACYDVVSHGR